MRTLTTFALLTTLAASITLAAPKKPAANDKPAATSTTGDTVMVKRGSEVFSDDFAREELGPKWKQVIPKVYIKDGALVGEEVPERMHGAVGSALGAMVKDCVVQFRFKFEGGTQVAFGFDDNTFKGSHAGHIARLIANLTNGVTMRDEKEGTMKNGIYEKTKDPQYKDEIAAVRKTTERNAKVKFEKDKWYTLTWEVLGDEALCSLDGKPLLYLKSPGFAHETKALHTFTVSGVTCSVDDFKVFTAEPDPNWPKKRDALIKQLAAPADQPKTDPKKNAPTGPKRKQ
jgi:hypothetical protein